MFEIQKGESSGRPISTSNAANVQIVKGSIVKNCRLLCYELESITGIPKLIVHDILVSHLDSVPRECIFPHKLLEINKAAGVLAFIEQFL